MSRIDDYRKWKEENGGAKASADVSFTGASDRMTKYKIWKQGGSEALAEYERATAPMREAEEKRQRAENFIERYNTLTEGYSSAADKSAGIDKRITGADEKTVRDAKSMALLSRDLYLNRKAFAGYRKDAADLLKTMTGDEEYYREVFGDRYDEVADQLKSLSETDAGSTEYSDAVKTANESALYYAGDNRKKEIYSNYGITDKSSAVEILSGLEKKKDNRDENGHIQPWKGVSADDEQYLLRLARERLTKDEAEKLSQSPYADDFVFRDEYGYAENLYDALDRLTIGEKYSETLPGGTNYNESTASLYAEAGKAAEDRDAFDILRSLYENQGFRHDTVDSSYIKQLEQRYGINIVDAVKREGYSALDRLEKEIISRQDSAEEAFKAGTGYNYETVKSYADREADKAELAKKQAEWKRNAEGRAGVVNWLASVPVKIAGAIEGWADVLQYEFSGERGSENYRVTNVFDNTATALSSTLSGVADEQDREFWKSTLGDNVLSAAAHTFVSGTASAIDSAAVMAASSALFGPLGGAMGQFIISSEAGASELFDQIANKGNSTENAIKYSAAVGIIEGLTEKWSFEQLVNKYLIKDITGQSFKKLLTTGLKNSFAQGLSEGSEEFFSYVGDAIADRIINGSRSERNAKIREYERTMSHDEAVKRVNIDMVGEALEQVAGGFAGGFFLGGVTNAGSVGVQAVNNRRNATATGRMAVASQGTAGDLAENLKAKLNIDDKTFRELFGKDGKKLAGAKATIWNKGEYSGKVYRAAAKVVEKAEEAAVKNAAVAEIKTELTARGISENEATGLAEDIYRSAYKDKKVSKSIKNNETAGAVLRELTEDTEEESPLKTRITESVWDAAQGLLDTEGETEDAATLSGDDVGTLPVTEEDLTTASNNDGGEMGDVQLSDGAKVIRYEEGLPVVEIDGKEVASDSIDFGNRDIKYLYNAGAEMTVNAANAMVRAYNIEKDSVNARSFADNFKLAYMLGEARANSKEAVAQYLKEGRLSISENAAEVARAMGAKSREESSRKASEKAVRNIKERGKGKVTYGTESAKNKATKEIKRVAEVLSRIGYNVEIVDDSYFENGENAHGAYLWSDTTIQLNADTATMQESIMQTLSHEITHSIQAINPQGYEALCAFIESHLKEFDTLVEQRQKDYGIDYDEAYDEVIAYGCQDMLERSDVLREFAEKHEDIFRDMMNVFREFLDSLKKAIEALTGKGFRSAPEAEGMKAYYDELAGIYKNAVSGTFEKINEAANIIPLSERFNEKNEDIRYSRKTGRSAVYYAYEIMDMFGIKKDAKNRDSIANTLEQMLNSVRADGEYMSEDFMRKMAEKAADLILPDVKRRRSDRANEILREIRGGVTQTVDENGVKKNRRRVIYINEEQAAEAKSAFGSVRNWADTVMGYVLITTDKERGGISLDSQWQEWADMFPELFSPEENTGNQVTRLSEIIESLKNDDEAEVIRDEEVASFAEYLYNLVRDEADTGEKPLSLIDALARTATTENELKAIAQYRQDEQQLERLLEAERNGDETASVNIEVIEKELLKLRGTKVFSDLIARSEVRARSEFRKKFSEREAERNEKKLRTEEIHRVMKLKERLDRALTNPSTKNNIPEDLQKTYSDFAAGLKGTVTYDIQQRIDGVEEKLRRINVRILNATDPDVIARLNTSKEELEELRKYYIEKKANDYHRMSELALAYERVKNDKNAGYLYDPEVDALLKNAAAIRKPLFKMTSDELYDVRIALTAFSKAVSDARKLIAAQIPGFDGATADELNKKAILEVESRRDNPAWIGKGDKHISSLMWKQLAPREVFRIIGNHTKNGVFEKIFQMFSEAQTKMLQIQTAATIMFEDKINTDDFRRLTSTKKEDLVDIGLLGKDGKPIKITRGFMLSVYMNSLHRDNADHMIIGGLTIPEMNKYYSGKKKAAFEKSIRTMGYSEELADAYDRLNKAEAELEDVRAKKDGTKPEVIAEIRGLEEQIDSLKKEVGQIRLKSLNWMSELQRRIENLMTDWEKDYIKTCQKFFDEFSKDEINRVTMLLYGYKKATVEGYFPILTDRNFLHGNINELVTYDFSLENIGMLKDRVHSANPILLYDITDVVSLQIDRVSRYCGFMPAIRNYNKIMGYVNPNYKKSLGDVLDATYGGRAKEYMDTFLKDIQGVKSGNNGGAMTIIAGLLRGHTAAATLTLNPRVALSQAASYPTAAKVVGSKALLKALKKGGKNGMPISSADRELIAKWSPYLYYREQGYNSVDMGELTANQQWKRVSDKMRFLTGWINFFDSATVGRLWYAAQYYVEDHNSDLVKGSDEYYMETAKIFNRIVTETQPNYTTAERPEILRSPNELVKSLAMFMTQRLQNVTILYESAAQLAKYRSDFKRGLNGVTAADVKEAGRQFRSAVTSQLFANATIVAMKLVTDLLLSGLKSYRDDDDELTLQSISMKLLDNFLDTVIGNVLLGSDIYSIGKALITGDTYYGMSLTGISSFFDTVEDTVKLVGKAISGKDVSEKELKNAAGTLGNVLGLPVRNTIQVIEALINHGKSIESKFEGYDESYWDTFRKDYNDTESKLYRYTLRGDTAGVGKLTAGMEEADVLDLYVTTLKKYDDRIYTAVEQRLSGQAEAYSGTVDAIAASGFDAKYVKNAVSKVKGDVLSLATDAVTAKENGDDEGYSEARDKMIDMGFGQRFCDMLIDMSEPRKEESASYKSLYEPRDMFFAFENGNNEGGQLVLNTLYSDKLEENRAKGKEEDEAVKDSVQSMQGSLITLYKVPYISGDSTERARIENILSGLTVDGMYVFGRKKDYFASYDPEILQKLIEDEKEE